MTSSALRRLTALPVPSADPAAPPIPAPRALPDAALLARLTGEFAASAAEHDRSAAFPYENFATLRQHGLIALTVPRAQGGSGATLAEARQVIAAIARGEPATALVLTMTWLQHHALARSDSRWPAHLRERIQQDTVGRGGLVNALRVEPALGSPARGGLPDTVARRDGAHWRLNGHKLYSTGIEGLSWLVVWGRTDEAAPRTGQFLVPRDTPGVRVLRSWDHLGLRASGSHDVLLEDVVIPLDHAVDLRAPADWAPDAGSQTDIDAHASQQAWMAVLLGSLYDAVARAARDWLVGFANQRSPSGLGTSLASLPRVQETLGEIEALLRTNSVLLDDAAAAVDRDQPPSPSDSGLLKYTVTNNAIRAAELALQQSGNHGLARQNPLERHYRDALCGRVHTPQNDASLVAAGKRALQALR